MSTHAEETVHHGPGVPVFAKVWVALLVLTGVEVLLAYLQAPLVIMLTALLGLSIIKAVLIIAWFMHLKFERLSLFLTLFPMMIVVLLLMLLFLPDAYRIVGMRPPS
jgi:cytochrome c oxidase subunit 4